MSSDALYGIYKLNPRARAFLRYYAARLGVEEVARYEARLRTDAIKRPIVNVGGDLEKLTVATKAKIRAQFWGLHSSVKDELQGELLSAGYTTAVEFLEGRA